jgi:hypothetical protein
MVPKTFLVITVTLVVFASARFASAQNSTTAKKDAAGTPATIDTSQASPDDFVNLLRRDIRSQKKQIIAENMELTDAEAEKFWPVYDQYTTELSKIYDVKLALLKDYADNYSRMTGEQAENYIRKRAEVEQSIMRLRLKYIPAFRKVLSGRETALFYQLDWRLGLACLIHIFEDNKGLLCYKHVVKTMFAATKEASECLKIAQHSVCCSQEFFASLS